MHSKLLQASSITSQGGFCRNSTTKELQVSEATGGTYIGLGGPNDAFRIGPEVLCENKLAYSSQLSLSVGEEKSMVFCKPSTSGGDSWSSEPGRLCQEDIFLQHTLFSKQSIILETLGRKSCSQNHFPTYLISS